MLHLFDGLLISKMLKTLIVAYAQRPGQLPTLDPPLPEMQQLFASLSGNQKAMDRFAFFPHDMAPLAHTVTSR